MQDARIPKGYRELQDCEVFISECNKTLVILGNPCDESDNHNCDEMGCGSFDHVILIANVKVNGL